MVPQMKWKRNCLPKGGQEQEGKGTGEEKEVAERAARLWMVGKGQAGLGQ